MAAAKTHYEVLGVSREASHDEIKRAYHGLARRHHPDALGPTSARLVESARSRMVAINAAWRVLGEPARRRDYDLELGLRPWKAHPGDDVADNEPAEADVGSDYPDWFEPDDSVPAAHLEEEIDENQRRSVADFVVFVPVGLAALAVAAFALSLVVSSPALFTLSVALVPVTLVTFLLTPLVVIATRVRSRC